MLTFWRGALERSRCISVMWRVYSQTRTRMACRRTAQDDDPGHGCWRWQSANLVDQTERGDEMFWKSKPHRVGAEEQGTTA